ncbi:MAG: ABC transporter substrate-binding protein [archaeon]
MEFLKKKFVLISFLIIAILVVGFLLNFSNTGFFTVSQTTSSSQTLKVGALVPLTGAYASIGSSVRNGLDLAKADLVKQNPNRDLQLIYEDACMPKDTVGAFTKLAEVDKINFLGADFCIIGFVPVIPLAQERKMLAFNVATNPDLMINQPFIYSFNKSIKSDSFEIVKMSREKLKAKTAAVVFYNTQLGLDYNNYLATYFEASGGEVVYTLNTELTNTDFRFELTKIKEKNPDVVFVILLSNQLGSFIKQARELGLSSTLISQYTAEDKVVLDSAQGSAEGVIISSLEQNEVTPKMAEFKKNYFAKYGKSPDVIAAIAYDSLVIEVNAFEKCGGVTSCMENEILNLTLPLFEFAFG